MVTNGKECKLLENLWWLQLSKRQKLTSLPSLWFGTERSEVRILSPPERRWMLHIGQDFTRQTRPTLMIHLALGKINEEITT